jgi:hypothetical protein
MLILMKSKLHNSDGKTSLPICYLLCACLHNGSTFCKISHMWNALNNGEEHASNIAMLARQYAFCNCWAYFCKGKMCLVYAFTFVEFNGCFTS